jgi:hypothetical protein
VAHRASRPGIDFAFGLAGRSIGWPAERIATMARALRQLHPGQLRAGCFGRYRHRGADRRRPGDCRDGGAFSYGGFNLGATTWRQRLRHNRDQSGGLSRFAHAPLDTRSTQRSPNYSAGPVQERVGPVGLPQLRERLLLDLPDALTSKADVTADLVERVRPTLGEPEAQR